MAVVAGAALGPSAAALEPDPPAEAVSSAVTYTDEGELRLDRAQAQTARARAASIMQQETAAPSGLSPQGVSPQGVTVRSVERFAGKDRYQTAANLANHYWGDLFWNDKDDPVPNKLVFVASGANFADALSGGATAGAAGGPLLLTRPDDIPQVTLSTIEKLKPDTIVVLGGTAAISTKVEGQLAEYANVHRFTGKDRYEVSAALARFVGWSPVAYVASGVDFPDGLAGGAAAGNVIAPLLLTRADGVPAVVLNDLRDVVKPQQIYVVGGRSAVSDKVVEQLKAIAPVERIDGNDRYVVAAKVAAQHPTQRMATVASGQDWPDALAGSALAGLIGSKLLLVRKSGVPGATQQAIVKHSLTNIDVLGGTGKVSEDVVEALKAL